LIDGAGFFGRAEFQLLKDRCKYILLDDTNPLYSFKNHLNRQEILANPGKWTVLEDDLNLRNGWMIAVNNFATKNNDKRRTPAEITKANLVERVFAELENQQVDFVTLRGFDLMPNEVSIKQDVDLLIHPDSIRAASEVFMNNGFTATNIDPADTVYLYSANPSIFFRHEPLDVAFHVVQELSYKGLNQGEMVPMDKELQVSIFENKRRVDEIWKYMPSYEEEALMLICRCIYDKRTVPQSYKARIEKLFETVTPERLQKYCEFVFLKFTPLLLSLIEKKKTEYIFEKYITFCDY
jgi:hypothetical protein